MYVCICVFPHPRGSDRRYRENAKLWWQHQLRGNSYGDIDSLPPHIYCHHHHHHDYQWWPWLLLLLSISRRKGIKNKRHESAFITSCFYTVRQNITDYAIFNSKTLWPTQVKKILIFRIFTMNEINFFFFFLWIMLSKQYFLDFLVICEFVWNKFCFLCTYQYENKWLFLVFFNQCIVRKDIFTFFFSCISFFLFFF